jgi:hypothetical protein
MALSDELLEMEARVNWVGMFAGYCAGAALEDLSNTYAVPLPLLEHVARTQDWAGIAARVSVPANYIPTPDQTRLAVIEENRRRNYELASGLRERLVKDVLALQKGDLKIEKAVVHRGTIIHTELEPAPQDIVALANAIRATADVTYRALGDVEAKDRTSTGVSEKDIQSITVILPTVVHQIASNHDERPVIDLRPLPLPQSKPDAAPVPRPFAAGVEDAMSPPMFPPT